MESLVRCLIGFVLICQLSIAVNCKVIKYDGADGQDQVTDGSGERSNLSHFDVASSVIGVAANLDNKASINSSTSAPESMDLSSSSSSMTHM